MQGAVGKCGGAGNREDAKGMETAGTGPAESTAMFVEAAKWWGSERPVAGLAESGAPLNRLLLAVVGAGKAPLEVVLVC